MISELDNFISCGQFIFVYRKRFAAKWCNLSPEVLYYIALAVLALSLYAQPERENFILLSHCHVLQRFLCSQRIVK